MTPAEFLAAVQTLAAFDYDPEHAHCETDSLMESLLTDLGYGEGVEAINSMVRWYS